MVVEIKRIERKHFVSCMSNEAIWLCCGESQLYRRTGYTDDGVIGKLKGSDGDNN